MKMNLKIFLTLIGMAILINVVSSQSSQKRFKNIDSTFKTDRKDEDLKQIDLKYQEQIFELNKQVLQLTETVADTKQTFYDSKLNLWNFILTALGIIALVAGYFGYKSISETIQEFKIDNERAITKSEEGVKEIKTDLIQRIQEAKTDIKDYKREIESRFEKFEKESKEKIDIGLSSQLQNAIDRIMKESFSSELNELSEQLAELTTRFENFISKNDETKNEAELKNEFDNEVDVTEITKRDNNAFN